MAFDQSTRNRLQRFVGEARGLLTVEFTRQLQKDYGLDPESGNVTPLENLAHLDNYSLGTARILRETLDHYASTDLSSTTKELLERIVREQAFTVINRLVALRMAEARGILYESVSKGHQSVGFQLYSRLAGTALGETHESYKQYLFSIFDEFALDLAVLFDRFSPSGRLFPGKAALEKLLDLINDAEIINLWGEDETIGWIYQYFNSKDERKKMRDDSSAPRNSRELAVRNQFFTPRYVVEFLTDNTLGRTWYEMTGGETSMVENCHYLVRRPNEVFLGQGENAPEHSSETGENLSQEELLKQTVYIPHRPMKDPREILMLDPACGSMHFGLYAFDLFLTIYAEAWDLEAAKGADVFKRSNQFNSLHETYENDREKFLRDVPRLVIENNIHGVDIDPRAVQIAGLSLWLRAQRAWSEQNVKPLERPIIRRSNIVCAEPMPGEANLLEEFITKHFSDTPEKRLLGEFVGRIFDSMRLAGEVGSLLKIEEEVASLISESREQWRKLQASNESFLFEGARINVQAGFDFEVGDITDENFWDRAESEIYQALRHYSEVSEDGAGYQRRLFADDAAQGFAFIDICRRKYDAILMNPPFGLPSMQAEIQQKLNSSYPKYKKNLAVAFIYSAKRMTVPNGRFGVICDRSLFFRKSYKGLRNDLLSLSSLLFADLGWDVMDDANVEASAFTISTESVAKLGRAIFFDVRNVSDRQKSLLDLTVNDLRSVSFKSLSKFPNSAFAHWVVPSLIDTFAKFDPSSPQHFQASNGMSACDSVRFLRLWWEIPLADEGWKPLAHGGKYSPFMRPLYFVVNWKQNGSEVKEYIIKRYPYLNGDPGWVLKNEEKFFNPGLTYGKRTAVLNSQVMPSGSIFSDEGQAVFPSFNVSPFLVLGFLNTRLVRYLINCYCGQHKHSGYLNVIPWVDLQQKAQQNIIQNAKEGISLRFKWESLLDFCSKNYALPTFNSISLSKGIRARLIVQTNEELIFLKKWLELQSDFEEEAGLSLNDYSEYIRACGGNPLANDFLANHQNLSEVELLEENEAHDEGELDEEDAAFVNLPVSHYGFAVELAKTLNLPLESLVTTIETGVADALFVPEYTNHIIDVLFGSVLGRWNVRFATGEKSAPELPDPFAPLPVCPPGMLQNAKNLPAAPEDVPVDYPLKIVWNGILVDDAGHSADIETNLRRVLQVIWKESAEAIETEACEILGVRSLRDYFRRPAGFFADHLKRYSKSRRQAPIYLPLSTRSGEYTLWLYYHRLTDQTLYACVNDYVEPKLKAVQNELNILRSKQSRTTDDEKLFERLQSFTFELEEMRDELLRLAPVWKPNLNDGVQITMSPLWKLFNLPKWRKTLEDTWKKLEKGEYDWAHLAYSLYPERVREKCVKDKSLAIAHDLESLYVGGPAKAKTKTRAKTAAPPRLLDQEENI